MNKVHPKILQRILRVSLDKLTEEQTARITKYILKLIRRSRGRRPKTKYVIEVLSWVLPDFPPLRALKRQKKKTLGRDGNRSRNIAVTREDVSTRRKTSS
jgi:hypothetical protein